MKFFKHFEKNIKIKTSPQKIFDYVDNHLNFSSHMNKPSLMMGGGKTKIELDDGKGKIVGSHIKMKGSVFGINIFLDEVITEHNPPYKKTWETIGIPELIIIGNYMMGFEIKKENEGSLFKVFIDYNLPTKVFNKILEYFLSGFYAKWCVDQIIKSTVIFIKS
ncbi:hypothetical protein A2422_01550 [Candidatus Woesebacteria bacterium RIFOXYC1_FULL_31_51]|uniref:Coenzyme Q-binding protein COQ10 START domain-containing protein n=1 Tax=Candidatus Woesebacteria bacterium GW2011_GWC2_31_9 TaxID=1618586 RepID=A0A0F9YZH4_9BACT|nr:MAG: hypothetical protein UR17_C0001G0764 [Candidatus Woesebacteria bacterium GW2011_GWF1_31_35]KKP22633.1 MAG: hypothetical protein UR11_C0002G0013 [Candidatus Woesebacteria bacterium GW2011_GWC1_30_29]KKP26935.1 MAG: hypothetical protein UR13_C0001G0030 [Candidatus Woesebacteria bacterium GW2011_GWD1_31_12]KKP27228.1 MAG: hypothetical protein UR16_C0005G0015 [Candidatus Woesebacteria bacterium GW2011_GWB1_31_29]KKP30829.1 MAG: hypothetical protein UR20_C0051G0013 [Candidatus Woesebacteria 